MHIIRRPHSNRRYARFFAWLAGVLFWMLCGACNPVAHARHRRRYGHLSLNRLTRAVRDLILLRAADFTRAPAQLLSRRDFAPSGFIRRNSTRFTLRRIARARLRKALRRGQGFDRILNLLSVLSRVDDYARAVAARASRFMRLRPLILVRPRATLLASIMPCAPQAADSS